jgi:hypothetical protein
VESERRGACPSIGVITRATLRSQSPRDCAQGAAPGDQPAPRHGRASCRNTQAFYAVTPVTPETHIPWARHTRSHPRTPEVPFRSPCVIDERHCACKARISAWFHMRCSRPETLAYGLQTCDQGRRLYVRVHAILRATCNAAGRESRDPLANLRGRRRILKRQRTQQE